MLSRNVCNVFSLLKNKAKKEVLQLCFAASFKRLSRLSVDFVLTLKEDFTPTRLV